MRSQKASVQTSFRLTPRTLELLEAAAHAAGESRNATADRLLSEAARLEHHPLIRFQRGAAGRRKPLVVGTRLYVHQVISTVRSSGGDVDAAARYFAVPRELVQAAVNYYADYPHEVEADTEEQRRTEERERERWIRQQNAVR